MTDRFSADDLSRSSAAAPRSIDLAHTKSFSIGRAEVRPASREIIIGDDRELLEPLVMQVLIALHSAKGATLSRDDLIDACWGGRAISDDAISRVISKLRSLGRASRQFEVETIPKIGYRLIERSARGAPLVPKDSQRRRLILASGVFMGLGAIGATGWHVTRPARNSALADLLIQKGMNALQRNDALDMHDPGATLEAVALLTDATEAAPESAPAWGALALALATRKRAADVADRPGLDARSRAAARTALKLDPGEERALGALRLLEPLYRNWIAAEQENRRVIGDNPKLPILLFIMSDMLGSVGRWKDALQFSGRLDRKRFLIPGADRKLIVDLWAAGDLQAADHALEVAVNQWPQHPQIWRTWLTYLLFSGRSREALAVVDASSDRPPEIPPDYFDVVRSTAEALVGRLPAADPIGKIMKHAKANPKFAPWAMQACAALGASSLTFDLLDGYYFGQGPQSWIAPKGGDPDRITNFLFLPAMRTLWKSGHFSRLLERIGLEKYWRTTGTQPDYRLT